MVYRAMWRHSSSSTWRDIFSIALKLTLYILTSGVTGAWVVIYVKFWQLSLQLLKPGFHFSSCDDVAMWSHTLSACLVAVSVSSTSIRCTLSSDTALLKRYPRKYTMAKINKFFNFWGIIGESENWRWTKKIWME